MSRACCGAVALRGELAELFATTGADPLARADVDLVPSLAAPGGRTLWETLAHDEATGATQHQALVEDGSRQVLVLDGAATVETDLGTGRIRAVAHRPELVAQLLAAVALPLLARSSGAHVLHGAAMATGQVATAVIGPSGAGKSTLLRAAVDAGWEALTEDVCVLDPPPATPPRVWPGPPWVRLPRTDELPPPWRPRFTTTDKTAWDLGPHLAPAPRPLGRLVLLEPAGADTVDWQALDRPRALARLVPHVTWLGSTEERSADAFAVAVRLARSVEVRSLRVPRSDRWTDIALERLSSPWP